jgi:hypothetical protein
VRGNPVSGTVTDLARVRYACWLRDLARVFLKEGYRPADLDGVVSDPEVGHYFAEIRAVMSRLLGRPS